MTEIKKCYYLSSASWRPRKAGGIIQSKYKGLKNGGSYGINPIPKAGKDISYPSSAVRQENRGGFLLLLPFCSIQALNRWEDVHPPWREQSALGCALIQMLISSRIIPINTPRNDSIGVGEDSESPTDCKEIQPVHPKDHSWVFIGRTDVEGETPILWPPDAKS